MAETVDVSDDGIEEEGTVASWVMGSFSLGMLLAALGRNLLPRSSSYKVFAFILRQEPKHNIQYIF